MTHDDGMLVDKQPSTPAAAKMAVAASSSAHQADIEEFMLVVDDAAADDADDDDAGAGDCVRVNPNLNKFVPPELLEFATSLADFALRVVVDNTGSKVLEPLDAEFVRFALTAGVGGVRVLRWYADTVTAFMNTMSTVVEGADGAERLLRGHEIVERIFVCNPLANYNKVYPEIHPLWFRPVDVGSILLSPFDANDVPTLCEAWEAFVCVNFGVKRAVRKLGVVPGEQWDLDITTVPSKECNVRNELNHAIWRKFTDEVLCAAAAQHPCTFGTTVVDASAAHVKVPSPCKVAEIFDAIFRHAAAYLAEYCQNFPAAEDMVRTALGRSDGAPLPWFILRGLLILVDRIPRTKNGKTMQRVPIGALTLLNIIKVNDETPSPVTTAFVRALGITMEEAQAAVADCRKLLTEGAAVVALHFESLMARKSSPLIPLIETKMYGALTDYDGWLPLNGSDSDQSLDVEVALLTDVIETPSFKEAWKAAAAFFDDDQTSNGVISLVRYAARSPTLGGFLPFVDEKGIYRTVANERDLAEYKIWLQKMEPAFEEWSLK